jgi:anti-sigma B factor antagonist
MNISQRTVQKVCVLDIDGPITLGADGSEKLGDKVRSVLQTGEKQVLLNLSAVAYIDSAGLGELVNAFTTVKKQGGALKLVGVTKKLKDLLVITKLATVFDSYDTEAEALESYGA